MTDSTEPVTADDDPTRIDMRLIELAWSVARYTAIRDMDRASERERAEADQVLERLTAEAAPLEDAYERRRWARWFFVPGGHVHREGRCSTLFESTELVLAPQASGGDDKRVVELYGWHVCTTCVPDAPTLPAFRSPGSQAAAEADASGDCLNTVPMEVNRRYHSPYGRCGDCGARGVAVTSLGKLRKHKHQRKADDAAREARLSDPKLIGTPDGKELRVGGSTLRTVRTAEIEYVDTLVWAGGGGNPDYVREKRDEAATIAEALAAKFGCSTAEIEERYAKRVHKKLVEWGRA